jgi:hypothetical protein
VPPETEISHRLVEQLILGSDLIVRFDPADQLDELVLRVLRDPETAPDWRARPFAPRRFLFTHDPF